MKQFGLRLPTELHKAIRTLAFKQETSMNSLIIEALEKFMQTKEVKK